MSTPHVLPMRTCSEKLCVCLLIAPVVDLNPVIWSRAGGESCAIGAVFALLSAGQPLFATGTAPITAVGTLVALSLPSAFLAVTTARSVSSPSPPFSRYEFAVAPEMSAQLPPVLSQRRHW